MRGGASKLRGSLLARLSPSPSKMERGKRCWGDLSRAFEPCLNVHYRTKHAQGGMFMPVACHLRILLARLNVERARQGQPAVSLRRLAQESGVSQSVLVALHTQRNQRIDYATIDRLLSYFSRFLPVRMDDLLTWEPAQERNVPAAMLM